MSQFAPKIASDKAVNRRKNIEPRTVIPSTATEAPLVQRKPACVCGGSCPRCQADSKQSVNRTGMPQPIKTGLEVLSGMDLSGLRVHTNSVKAAQLNALAYTQGQDIHLGPGQEKHLPHEGWHAVQQLQGRVKPTMQAKDVSINDDKELEREADVMGARALHTKEAAQTTTCSTPQGPMSLQRGFETWDKSEVSRGAIRKSEEKTRSNFLPTRNPVSSSSGQNVVQRKVKITGLTEEKRKAFLGKINASATGIQFKMDASGFLKRAENKIVPTREYTKQLIAAIDDAQTVNLNLIAQNDNVFIDSFASGEVDYDDMIGLEGNMFRNWLMHFVVERFAIANYETNKAGASAVDFRKAHEKGHEAQEKQLKAWYPTKTIKYVGEGLENATKKVDASGNGTVEYHFNFTDVKLVFVQNMVNNVVKESIVSSKFVVVK